MSEKKTHVPEHVKNIFRSVLTSEGLDAALVAVSGYFGGLALREEAAWLRGTIGRADRTERRVREITANFLEGRADEMWPDGF